MFDYDVNERDLLVPRLRPQRVHSDPEEFMREAYANDATVRDAIDGLVDTLSGWKKPDSDNAPTDDRADDAPR